jgi:hypothetical protein
LGLKKISLRYPCFKMNIETLNLTLTLALTLTYPRGVSPKVQFHPKGHDSATFVG